MRFRVSGFLKACHKAVYRVRDMFLFSIGFLRFQAGLASYLYLSSSITAPPKKKIILYKKGQTYKADKLKVLQLAKKERISELRFRIGCWGR